MVYPDDSALRNLIDQLHLYSHLKQEQGARGIDDLMARADNSLQDILVKLKALPVNAALSRREPDDLLSIRQLRPAGPRRIWHDIDSSIYREKLQGALLGRMAGCILGVPVEGWPVERMAELAKENGDSFPPTDYWKYIPSHMALQYNVSPREMYTRLKMQGVPVDDDLTYTLLGLLMAEEYGPDFTTNDVAKAWLKYLPIACTAEEITLKNLKAGISARQAGAIDNPFTEWIGADIRSDPWGYLAPGWPELAADLAYRDAYLSHRRTGIYGEMLFSAAISAAFTVNDPLEAIQIGLTEIPANCQLAQHVMWALEESQHIGNYREARKAVDERFPGMDGAHTINNACLTVFGLAIGRVDFSRVISETVAMGMDNDCTTATAGSIAGAVLGKAGIPVHWYQHFNDIIYTYMIGVPSLAISDVVQRFFDLANLIHKRK
jgi:ADP-ribosylglycohydrolase